VIILPKGAGMAGPGGRGPSFDGLRGRLPGTAKLKPKAEAVKKTPEQVKEESRVAAKLEAIDDLEDKNDPKSIAALAEMLSDPSREVKEAALQALADKEGANVTQLIQRGLNDRDPGFAGGPRRSRFAAQSQVGRQQGCARPRRRSVGERDAIAAP
jgi:hypothetical protein